MAKFITPALVFTALSICLNAQPLPNKTIKINPNLPESPLTKEGYVLLFSDEFETLNTSTWNRSGPGDYSSQNFCEENKNSPKNASNVSVVPDEDGTLILKVREGEEQNLCSHSSSEIKSFSASLQQEGPFDEWVLPPKCYVEIRTRVTDCGDVGSSFWLYGVGFPNGISEPDIFELKADLKNIFQANFHYGPNYIPDGKALSAEIHVKNLNGDNIDLDDYDLNFGIFWDKTQLSMELNGIEYYNVEMLYEKCKSKICKNPYRTTLPYHVLLGAGAPLLGTVEDCNSLPDNQKVDYIRVYIEEGAKAVNLYGSNFKPTNKIQVCSWSGNEMGDNVYVDYYPGAAYLWQLDPALKPTEYTDPNSKTYRHFWIAPKTDALPGTYPCTLTVTFPSGYQEILNLNVEIQPSTLPAAADILLLNYPPTISYPVGVLEQPFTTGYEWSEDGGLSWMKIPNSLTYGNINRFAVDDPISYTEVDACVRAYNTCTREDLPNPSICETIILPHITPNQFLTGPPFPETITVELADDPDVYELRTPVLDSTTAFFWSFDEETWFKEENPIEDTLNRFGFFAPGTPPFNIFLRSELGSELSEVYSQWVVIPDSSGQIYGLQQPLGTTPLTLNSKTQQTREFLSQELAQREIVEIYTIHGVQIWRGSLNEYESAMFYSWNLLSGIYLVVFKDDSGQFLEIQKKILLKQ